MNLIKHVELNLNWNIYTWIHSKRQQETEIIKTHDIGNSKIQPSFFNKQIAMKERIQEKENTRQTGRKYLQNMYDKWLLSKIYQKNHLKLNNKKQSLLKKMGQRPYLTDTSPKIHRRWTSTWKASTLYVIREMHIEQDDHYTLLKWPKSKSVLTPNAGTTVEPQELSLAAGDARWRGRLGRQCGSFSRNRTCSHHTSQQSHCLPFTHRGWKPAHRYFLAALFKLPKLGGNQDVLR